MSVAFPGRIAFITGAASGIGLALAEAFAAAGARVVLTDIDVQALERAAASLRQAGAAVLPLALDVTRPDAWLDAADRVQAEWGPVDILCNNAGMVQGRLASRQPMRLTDVTPAHWNLLLQTNLSSVYHGVHTFAPRMVARGAGGHIVNTASMAGVLAPPGLAAYAATKFAVVALSEALRAELAPQGIGVSVLCPGGVQSNLMATSAAQRAATPGASDGMGEVSAPRPSGANPLMAPGSVARRVLEAVAANELYVFTHPEYEPLVAERFAAVLSAFGASAQAGYADSPGMVESSRSPTHAALAAGK